MGADNIFAASGKCLLGPAGTELPAEITDINDPALVDLGEVSEDGLEHSFAADKTTIKNWKGLPVRVIGTSLEITFKLTFLETRKREILELFYGAAVEAAGDGSKIVIGQPSDEARVMVIPTEDPGTGKVQAYCLPAVVVSDRGSVTVKPDEAGFELTFTALVDPTLGSAGYILFDEDLTAPVTPPVGG